MKKYSFSNTYPVFLKFINAHNNNDILSDGIFESMYVNNDLVKDTEITPSIIRKIFFKKENYAELFRNNIKKIYGKVRNRDIIRLIYSDGAEIINDDKFDSLVTSIMKNDSNEEIKLVKHLDIVKCKNGYTYCFLVDEEKKIIFLINYFLPNESNAYNLFVPLFENRPVFEEKDNYIEMASNKYFIYNTYVPFCKFADDKNEDLSFELNKPFINEIKAELSKVRDNGTGIEKNELEDLHFKYITYQNKILVYDYINQEQNKIKKTIHIECDNDNYLDPDILEAMKICGSWDD